MLLGVFRNETETNSLCGQRLLVIAALLDLLDERLHLWLDAVEDGLWVEAEEEAQTDQRRDARELAEADVLHPRVLAGGPAHERALERPEQVHGGEDDADRGDDRVRLLDDE